MKYTDAQVRADHLDYQAGRRVVDIAEARGKSVHAIYQRFQSIDLPKNRRDTSLLASWYHSLYMLGYSCHDVAKPCHTSGQTVWRIMSANDYRLRKRGGKGRKYSAAREDVLAAITIMRERGYTWAEIGEHYLDRPGSSARQFYNQWR